MKNKFQPRLLALAIGLSTINSQLSTAHAQGTLTPPGAPAPTMKSLAQIEPRTPISSLPFTISAPGSYYVTTNLTGVSGSSGITIASGNVTLDLNGFMLAGVPGSFSGVVLGGITNATVGNGSISGWPGSGVNYSTSSARNFVIHHLHISATGSAGINAGNALISECTVTGSGGDGIDANTCTVRDCMVDGCAGNFGINLAPGTATRCLVLRGAATGIFCNAPGCVVSDNVVRGNNTSNFTAHAGILLNDSYNRIENNQVFGNGVVGAGISGALGYTGNLIIRNSVSGSGANNYAIIGTQAVGPIITTAGTITNTSPWANFSF